MSQPSSEEMGKKPNWLLLKEAAEELYRSGKIYFTRRDLTENVMRKDPSRSPMSIDFEIDLVCVNSGSKDKYRDPDKLFLYRVDRGRYTLYNPEEHGELDKYIEVQRVTFLRKQIIDEVLKMLEEMGYDASINKYPKALQPDIVAEKEDERIGVWIVDPGAPLSTQYKGLGYAIGASLLNREYNQYIIVIPTDLIKRIPQGLMETLKGYNIRLATIREERKYSLQL